MNESREHFLKRQLEQFDEVLEDFENCRLTFKEKQIAQRFKLLYFEYLEEYEALKSQNDDWMKIS